MENVTVDKDILSSLKALYFGTYDESIEGASSRAYRDMNRTIRFNGTDDTIRIQLREQVTTLLKREIFNLETGEIKTQEEYDMWHRNLCDKIKQAYAEKSVKLTAGQAQKWINMTIKYLYLLEHSDFENVFTFLHVPLDNYVFDIAEEHLGIKRPIIAWSKWDDYDRQYLEYQKEIRKRMTCYEPLRWEFKYWLKSARKIEVGR